MTNTDRYLLACTASISNLAIPGVAAMQGALSMICAFNPVGDSARFKDRSIPFYGQ